MILKEIDMDLPYIVEERKSHMNQEEILQDYQKNWKWKRHNFNLTNRCMMSMIERLMPRIETENFWKILIECVDKVPDKKHRIVGGVCEVQVLFDLSGFYTMSAYEKKQYAIEKTREAMTNLSSAAVSGVLEACDKIVEANYENIWFWKTSKKKKNLSVQIKVVHEVDFVCLYMVFTESKTKMTEEFLLTKEKPSEWFFADYFGTLKWVDDKTAKLITKDGKEFMEKCHF